jgi:hypothetical protein
MSVIDESAVTAELARLRAALRVLDVPASSDEAARAIFASRRRTAATRAPLPAMRRAPMHYLAAALLAAVAAGVGWVVVERGAAPPPGLAAATPTAATPAALAFQPLVNSPGFSPTSAYSVVRVRIPLASFALVPGSEQEGTIEADLLVGEDGLARGIRFTRADALVVSANSVLEGSR